MTSPHLDHKITASVFLSYGGDCDCVAPPDWFSFTSFCSSGVRGRIFSDLVSVWRRLRGPAGSLEGTQRSRGTKTQTENGFSTESFGMHGMLGTVSG